MTENDDFGCHFVGYFSKEKRSSSMNNVSCILVLPIHQRRGFGHFLIDFSYLLTRVEKKTGSPEKPLSDMGLVSYRSYWRLVMCYQLVDRKSAISVAELSDLTGMTADDIVSALEALRAIVRDPDSGTYALRLDLPFYREYVDKYESKAYCKINPDALVWTPYVMGRTSLANYDERPPLHTIAQREEEEGRGEDEGEGEGEDQQGQGQGQQAGAHGVISTQGNGVGVVTASNGSHTELNGGMNAGHKRSDGDDMVSASADGGASVASGSAAVDGSIGHGLLSVGSFTASPSATRPSTPKTAVANGESAIPAWKFQIWPPLPSATPRRRSGRPFGHRRRTTTTPLRRSITNGNKGEQPTSGRRTQTTPARRTRSKLGEVTLNGLSDHPEGADAAAGPSAPSKETSVAESHSGTGVVQNGTDTGGGGKDILESNEGEA